MANEKNAASLDDRETDQVITEGELDHEELDELSGGTVVKGLKSNCGTQDSGTMGCGG